MNIGHHDFGDGRVNQPIMAIIAAVCSEIVIPTRESEDVESADKCSRILMNKDNLLLQE
jgi:hypothetical protein